MKVRNIRTKELKGNLTYMQAREIYFNLFDVKMLQDFFYRWFRYEKLNDMLWEEVITNNARNDFTFLVEVISKEWAMINPEFYQDVKKYFKGGENED